LAADRISQFIHEPDPDNPGWHSWNLADSTRVENAMSRRRSKRSATWLM